MLQSFIFAAIFVIFIVLVMVRRSPKYKGKKGEMKVHDVIAKLPNDYVKYDDVVLKTSWGTTQIDHVVVSRYGVFVIETKNYRGDIYGSDEKEEWKQVIVTPVRYQRKFWKEYTYVTKNKMYNPVKQCQTHINALKKTVGWNDMPAVLLVVFTGDANLSKVWTKHHVIYIENLEQVITGYTEVVMNDSDVLRVCDAIEHNNVRDTVDERTHVRNIQQVVSQKNLKIANGICPKCGGKLVQRNGRYGTFYGCSNYPQCRFTCEDRCFCP